MSSFKGTNLTKKCVYGVLGLAAAAGIGLSTAKADVTTLVGGASTATVDFSSPNPALAGMTSWFVGGQNQLKQQWFWYRAGNMTYELPINAGVTPTLALSGTSGVIATYARPGQFDTTITYTLNNSSATSSDISETIKIVNNSGGTLSFHFFQYSDFDLGGTPLNDSVTIYQSPNGLITGYDAAYQSKDQVIGLTESVTGANPPANEAEANITPITFNSLTDLQPTTLNGQLQAGPGDVSWAFQWDFDLAPNQAFLLAKDKQLTITLVPEPGVLALVAMGLAGLALRRRS